MKCKSAEFHFGSDLFELNRFCLNLALVLWVSIFLAGCGKEGNTSQSSPTVEAIDPAGLKIKAENGDALAQLEYGKFLSAKMDYKVAAEWIKKSSDGGNAAATSLLGELTQAGQGVPRDPKLAVVLFRKAAERGNVSGQYNLGYCYERGAGVENDEKEASKWYLLAAEGGDNLAQYDIGQRYELGQGVTADPVQAYKWYAISSRQGQPDSAKKLVALKPKLATDQITQAEKLVSDFEPRRQ